MQSQVVRIPRPLRAISATMSSKLPRPPQPDYSCRLHCSHNLHYARCIASILNERVMISEDTRVNALATVKNLKMAQQRYIPSIIHTWHNGDSVNIAIVFMSM